MATSPKQLVERVIEDIYNQGNLDLIDELYSPDIVREVLPMAPIVGREAMRQYVQEIRTAYPDLHIEIEQILFDGNWTATSFVMTGTHEGQSPSVPIPPTGKRFASGAQSLDYLKTGTACARLLIRTLSASCSNLA